MDLQSVLTNPQSVQCACLFAFENLGSENILRISVFIANFIIGH